MLYIVQRSVHFSGKVNNVATRLLFFMQKYMSISCILLHYTSSLSNKKKYLKFVDSKLIYKIYELRKKGSNEIEWLQVMQSNLIVKRL